MSEKNIPQKTKYRTKKIRGSLMSNNNVNESIESIISTFAQINISENMEQIVERIQLLQAEVAAMQLKLTELDTSPKYEEYAEVRVAITDAKEISLEMFKTLPTFGGEREKYVSWRAAAMNSMKIFVGHMESPRYFEALNIVRNKIIGSASETLTNYNTVFNFDAIIARLDFTYADKRPVHIIEQEMIVLQQRGSSIDEFYDEVNKKLNALINKINMTHKEREAAKAMVQEASEKALRTFITGLKGNLAHILYASNPSTLPEAYARIQTIINDQQRIRFANQFNQPQQFRQESSRSNPSFKPKQKFPYQNQQLGWSQQNGQVQNNHGNRPNIPIQRPEPMEVDRSSMNVNVGTQKRQFSGQHSFNKKFQRINQVENENSELGDETSCNVVDENEAEGIQDESGDETSSVFLDN